VQIGPAQVISRQDDLELLTHQRFVRELRRQRANAGTRDCGA